MAETESCFEFSYRISFLKKNIYKFNSMKPALQIFLAIAITAIFSCNSRNNEKSEPAEVVTTDTVYDYSDSFDTDSLLHVKNETLLWHANDSNGLRMRKPIEP